MRETVSREGSSPRMRGAPGPSYRTSPVGGIIPADAGSTPTDRLVTVRFTDHPRGCGEHCVPCRQSWKHAGSSPRMRGAPWCGLWPCLALRIIPADAGSTDYQHALRVSWEDHPRGCGEHLAVLVPYWSLAGSSPRMRGALRTVQSEPGNVGIIPADAGSTTHPSPTWKPEPDHPRGCGEHRPRSTCLMRV